METLIDIRNMYKIYEMGSEKVHALDGLNIKIYPKEFVAIIGPSGSGKSTLMNMIGCLDTPTSGEYLLEGIDIAKYTENELAHIRNAKIGFIFQQFNLFRLSTALENVEMPAKYMRVPADIRRERAINALDMVGLGERIYHKPTELSGGQQQRVAIARALVNNPPVLLADEPTGNLDSHSGEEIMNMIRQLHKEGSTIILITHDQEVAEQADRVVNILDGKITSDVYMKGAKVSDMIYIEAFISAIKAIWAHKMRSFLTMLGIIIGIFSVAALISLAQGTTASVTEQIEGMGSNLLMVNIMDRRIDLDTNDLEDITELDGVHLLSPYVESAYTLKYGNLSMDIVATYGVTEEYTTIREYEVVSGRNISDSDDRQRRRVAIVGSDVADELYGTNEAAVGQEMMIGGKRFTIIGSLASEGSSMMGNTDEMVLIPFSTAQRMMQDTSISAFFVSADDSDSVEIAQASVETYLSARASEEGEGYYVFNQSDILESLDSVTGTLTALLGGIAAISLLVGGIGIMNIMLVSVTERTREIGIQKAIGATRKDILTQFLIEAIIVSGGGGIIGLLFAYLVVPPLAGLMGVEVTVQAGYCYHSGSVFAGCWGLCLEFTRQYALLN